MGLLALGLFLILVGVAVTAVPARGLLASTMSWAGWTAAVLGVILAGAHVAVGPRMVRRRT